MPSPLIDTHAHLSDPAFIIDLAAVLEQAQAAGVEKIIAVGETIEDARRNLELAEQYSMILPAAGLYPTVLDLLQAEQMEAFIRENAHRLVAIGEVGMDYWKVQEEEERYLQRSIFNYMIDLAIELDLPLNVHSRSAGRAVIEMLLDKGARRVQLHAFDGRVSSALPAVDAGWFFSIPPSALRSEQKRKLVKKLPLECLLLESDSPALGPQPGQRNTPANITIALQAISEIKNKSVMELREILWNNSLNLYKGRLAIND
ncbi:MAG: TatD family hydrolase [Calditrichota bacterium]